MSAIDLWNSMASTSSEILTSLSYPLVWLFLAGLVFVIIAAILISWRRAIRGL